MVERTSVSSDVAEGKRGDIIALDIPHASVQEATAVAIVEQKQ